MTTFIGTAAGYRDLIAKLDQHLTATGHAWGLTFAGVGNGRLRGPGGTVGGYIGTAASVAETITVTFTSATNFNVAGTVSGSLGTGTVGADFTSAVVAFRVVAGSTPFSAGDVFTLNTSPKWTRHRLAGMGNPGDGFTTTLSNGTELQDGDNTGAVASTTTFPATSTWVMDFDTTVRAVRIVAGSTAGRGPSAFSLDWSDDGVTWTTLQTWSGVTGWQASEGRTFVVTSPVAKRRWRVVVTAGQTATLELWELRLCGDTTGTWFLDGTVAGIQAVWQSPGVDGITTAYHGLFTHVVPASDVWNLRLVGFQFWPNQAQHPSVPNIANTPAAKTLPLPKSTSIAYWLVVNGGRYVLLCRVSGVYLAAYSGFILPYEFPADYPFPMAVGGVTEEAALRWDTTSNGGFRNFMDPGSSSPSISASLAVMQPNGTWRDCYNRYSQSNTPEGASGANDGSGGRGATWPYAGHLQSTTASQQQLSVWRDCLDGSLPLLPIIIFIPPYTGFTGAILGEFDGVYAMNGFGNSAEALTREGALDVISWPNVFRTSRQNWAGIALD